MYEFLDYLKDENGQGMVEYGLIIAFIAIAVFVALKTLGDSVGNLFNDERLNITNTP